MLESLFDWIFSNVMVISIWHFWIGLCLPALMSLVALYYAFGYLRHARIIEDTPTSKIRSAAQGYVELKGIQKTEKNKPLYSKLSHTHCTWYAYSIAKRVTHQKQTSWHIIESDTSRAPFLLVGKTGTCFIYPEKAKVISPKILRWQGFRLYPKCYPKNFLIRFLGYFGPYLYTEKLLLPETQLYAIGMFETQTKAGQTINTLSAQNLPPRRPFILSQQSQSNIVFKYRLIAMGLFLLFGLLMAFSLGLLFYRPYLHISIAQAV